MSTLPDDDPRPGDWRPQGADRPRPARTRVRKDPRWEVPRRTLHTFSTGRAASGAWGLAVVLAVPAVASACLGDLVPALLFAVAAACCAVAGRTLVRERLVPDRPRALLAPGALGLAALVLVLGAVTGALG